MHAKELCFATASYIVKGEEGTVHEVEEIRVNLKATTATFVFGDAIPASATLVMTIQYTGFLNNEMAGFYRSSYTNIHGESKIMASTQFESLDARLVNNMYIAQCPIEIFNLFSIFFIESMQFL